MDAAIAIGHIVGSVVVVAALSLLLTRVGAIEASRADQRSAQELAVVLGVPLEDLQKEEMTQPISDHLLKRSSSKLLQNRLSDFCGILNSLWICLGCGVQGVIFFTVIFASIAGKIEVAAKAWWMVPTLLFFWLISFLFASTCRLLTGRSPGEARHVRKSLTGA